MVSAPVSEPDPPPESVTEAIEEQEAATPVSAASGDTIKIPLNAIIKQVPRELFRRGAGNTAVRGYYFLPSEEALDQLATGAVKVSIGELRKVAPKGLFVESADKESELVSLPLREILRRLKPEHYERRNDQVRVDVPESVSELFGPRGEALSEVRILKKDELRNTSGASTAAAPAAATASRSDTEHSVSFAGPAPKPPFEPSTPHAEPNSPIAVPDALREIMAKNAAARAAGAPALPGAPVPTRPPGQTLSPYSIPGSASPAAFPQRPASTPASPPTPPVKPAAPLAPSSRPAPLPQAQPRPLPTAPTAAPAPAAPQPAAATQSVAIPLDEISAEWPDSIRQEIAYLQLDSAHCHIPYPELAKGMKQGRVSYPWEELRSWLQPPAPADFATNQGEVILDIGLQKLMPHFLKGRSSGSRRSSQGLSGVPSATEIPDVFQNNAAPVPSVQAGPVAPAAPAPATRPSAAPVPPAEPTGLDSIPNPFALPAQPAAPAHAAAASPAPAARSRSGSGSIQGDVFEIELEVVSADWPVPVLSELESKGLSNSKVAIPRYVLEEDLKTGKIEHNWADICGWIQDYPGDPEYSEHAAHRVTMPLHVIAPLFFARRSQQAAPKPFVPSDIPDVFGTDQPAPAMAPGSVAPVAPAAPVHTTPDVPVTPEPQAHAAPVTAPQPAATAAPQPESAQPAPTNIAELFGEPGKKNWTPNEIVNKTAGLNGVDGALIALQDGLLVASCMPPEWKTETVAAFLPQMFGRMDQYARELSVGDLKSLAITVGQGTLVVFNAGLTYFAAMARGGRSVPMQELTLIANELSRHTK